jgi:hypothetical protein
VDIAARSAETVNASHTAGRMSRQPRQRQRYFVSFAARDIGERHPSTGTLPASAWAQLPTRSCGVFGSWTASRGLTPASQLPSFRRRLFLRLCTRYRTALSSPRSFPYVGAR